MNKVEDVLNQIVEFNDDELFELMQNLKNSGKVIIPGFYTKKLAEEELNSEITEDEMCCLETWMDRCDFAFRDPLKGFHDMYLEEVRNEKINAVLEIDLEHEYLPNISLSVFD